MSYDSWLSHCWGPFRVILLEKCLMIKHRFHHHHHHHHHHQHQETSRNIATSSSTSSSFSPAAPHTYHYESRRPIEPLFKLAGPDLGEHHFPEVQRYGEKTGRFRTSLFLLSKVRIGQRKSVFFFQKQVFFCWGDWLWWDKASIFFCNKNITKGDDDWVSLNNPLSVSDSVVCGWSPSPIRSSSLQLRWFHPKINVSCATFWNNSLLIDFLGFCWCSKFLLATCFFLKL